MKKPTVVFAEVKAILDQTMADWSAQNLSQVPDLLGAHDTPKFSFATAEVGETDQFVTVAVECTPIYDATNGLITAVAKCGVDGICQ